MRKLPVYLKPFWVGLIAALALLFGQAMADLNLPNYMSDIVNVGVQQSGIEHAAPEAISPQGMQLVTAFLSAEDKALLTAGYAPVNTADADANGKTYASRYPKAEGALLVRKTDADLAALDAAFGRAAAPVMGAMQEASKATGRELALDSEEMSGFLKQVVYPALPMLSAKITPEALTAMREKMAAGGEAVGKQVGAALAKVFYTELGANLSAMQTGYILRVGAMMLLLALLGGAATIAVGYCAARICSGVARNMRRDAFARIEQFSQTEFDRFSSASLITRCTNDVNQLQMLIGMSLRLFIYAPIMGVGGVIMALHKASAMSWIIAVAVLVMMAVIGVVMGVALPKFKIMQKLVDRVNLVSRENLTGMMVVRAFSNQPHEAKRFEKANMDLSRTNLFTNRVMIFMMPMMGLVMNAVMLGVVWVGADQVTKSSIQVGDLMAFMQYAMQILGSFMMLAMMMMVVPRAAVSADRIAEVLDTVPSIRDPEQPTAFEAGKRGVVEFRGVNFRYQGAEEDALHDISFTALPGKTTAIIGPTGSGKSTIANLMLRFFDVTGGQVLVDGTDVRQATQKDLRDKIGFVPQKGMLLSGTIASNLAYGREDASPDDLREAAGIAQALEFIDEREGGLDAEIAQDGTNVSGGQKQRLSIARALAKRPEILLFDDSFSALDFKTDTALRKALQAHAGESTVVVIAQRVGTIQNADQIIVLDEGKMVGKGTHRELLQSCPLYLEIASSQMSKEELA